MSATLTAPALGTSGNPIANSTRAEFLRLRKWPAVWVTIGAWLTMNAMFGYVFNYVTYSSGDNSFSNEGQSRAELLAKLLPASIPDVLAQGMPMFGGAIMMVLGAIIAGNGYGWGAWKTVLTQGPSRTSTLAGSVSATTVLVDTLALRATSMIRLTKSLLFSSSQPHARRHEHQRHESSEPYGQVFLD